MCVSSGRLYAVGGQDRYDNTLSSVERCDEEKDQWEATATMNTAWSCAGVCVLGGRMYAVGGFDADGCVVSSVERYDEAKGQWEVVANMNSVRCGYGVCVCVCVLGGRLYAVGGLDADEYAVSSVERYNEANN